jgi:hypothetical protein
MNELKSRQGYINPKYVFYTTPLYLMNLKLVAPIFESQTLFKKFWLKLSKISKNKTENLLDDFLGITCSLYCSLSNKSKNLSDLKKSEKICTKSHQLCELMCEYEQLYYMHARVPLLEAKDLINMIKSFDFNACSYNKRLQNNKIIKDFYYSVLECATNFQEQKDTDIWIPLFDLVKESLKIFSILTLKEVKMQREYNKQSKLNSYSLLSRESKTSKTVEIFIRSISCSIRKNFNKPMYGDVAQIINLIFDSDYTYAEIAKTEVVPNCRTD